MNIATFEGVVEQGKIHLKTGIRLPEKIKVYVVVPDFQMEQTARIVSPHLVHPEQATDFKMEIIKETTHASV